jgi:inorganic pyrophosphatase
MKDSLVKLKTFDPETKDLRVVVETPKGSRNKFDYNEDLGVFELGYVLPEGATFPNEFGFIPSTLGEDGDPIDVMVLLDQPTAVGCVLTARLVGVIEAQQIDEGGNKCRNDRLIAVATHAHVHGEVQSLAELARATVDEIEHFFISYNEMRGRKFKPLGRHGPKRALQLVARGRKAFKKK